MEGMFLQYSSGGEKSKNVSQSISIRLGGISYNKCRNKQQIMVYNWYKWQKIAKGNIWQYVYIENEKEQLHMNSVF